jgi:hypothetical protein
MALKLTDTMCYLKLDLEGNFRLYKTAQDRALEKAAPSVQEVSHTYATIINKLWGDRERLYYDPTYKQEILAWEAEYDRYQQYCLHKLTDSSPKFPLMRQYIKNVEAPLPSSVLTGQIWVQGETLEEVYTFVKQQGYFQNIEDC